MSIPGISDRIVDVTIAETGADMSVFPTAGHLATPLWAHLWKGATDLLDAPIRAAKEDPSVANGLYGFAVVGCTNEASVRRLRDTFNEPGIPLDCDFQFEMAAFPPFEWRLKLIFQWPG